MPIISTRKVILSPPGLILQKASLRRARATVISASTRSLACTSGTSVTCAGVFVAQGPSLAFGLFTPKMRPDPLKGV